MKTSVLTCPYYDYDFDREHRAQNWFAELGAESEIMNCGQWNADVRPAGRPGFGFGGRWWRLYCGELFVRNVPTDPRGYARQLEASFLRASISWNVTDSIEFEYVFGQMEAESKRWATRTACRMHIRISASAWLCI